MEVQEHLSQLRGSVGILYVICSEVNTPVLKIDSDSNQKDLRELES